MHPRSQALLATCVVISPGTNRTETPQIVVVAAPRPRGLASRAIANGPGIWR